MLWFLPQERLAMKSLFAALYGPVFRAGFIGATTPGAARAGPAGR